MNHCIPNRQLKGGEVFEGVIVTPPMCGDTIHIVYRDKNSPLFRMQQSLFQCLKSGLSNTERLRREQVLEFGDKIHFTCVEGAGPNDNVVVDYEKTESSVGKVRFEKGKDLLKSLCVLPPAWASNNCKGAFMWTKIFGTIPVSSRSQEYISRRAYPDVAIHCWLNVSVDMATYTLKVVFDDFHEEGIAHDDMYTAWDTDWNSHNKPLPKGQTIPYSDEEDDEEELFHLDQYAIELGVKTKLEGVVISSHEVFCRSFPDKRVYVGLWREENVEDHCLEGYQIRFDAFYSDVIDAYIAYFYECDDINHGPMCEIHYVDDAASNIPNARILTKCQFYDYTLGGFLMHDYFGLVADRKNCLRALPILEEEAARESMTTKRDPHGATDRYVLVYIVDKGISNTLARFEIDCLPQDTERIVTEADERLAHRSEIVGEGFVVREDIGQIYAYKFPTLQFFVSNDERHKVSNGMWIRFKAIYMPEMVFFMIKRFEILYEKEMIDCRMEKNQPTDSYEQRFEFKISVHHHKLVKGALYGRMYGFVVDPHNEFKANIKLRSYDVVVVQDTENSATTLFCFKRMAKDGEFLSENTAKLGKIIEVDAYSEDEEDALNGPARAGGFYDTRGDVHDFPSDEEDEVELPDLSMIGLGHIVGQDELTDNKQLPKKTAEQWNDNRTLSGVEFNSKYLRRERKVEARQRKIERDRLARLAAAKF